MLDGGTGRVDPKVVVVFQIPRRAMRARRETSTTIGADVAQNAVYTAFAKGAFKRADHRFGRYGWKLFVAMLASWPEFKHTVIPS